MSNIYQGTLGLIGNTPLVELTHVEKAYGLEASGFRRFYSPERSGPGCSPYH